LEKLASGIIAAPPLPFNEDASINWAATEKYIAQVAQGGPRAIAMNMAASESSSLEIDEQLEVIKRCKAVIGGACLLLSGLTVNHTAAARDLARKVVDAGADGVIPFPPLPAFTAPIPVEMVEAYHRAIAETVDVPIVLFQTAATQYPKGTILSLCKIPNVVAIKDASFNIDNTVANINEAKAASRKIAVLTGSDTFVLEAMLMGCDGALIGLAATATKELVRMQQLAESKNVADAYEIWSHIGPVARLCWRPPLRDFRVRTKYVLQKQGLFPTIKMRDPFPALDAQDRKEINEVFEAVGFGDPRFLPAGRKV
jgi:4-hydroxy-tetrahydrodipicolinate synthase